MKQVLQQGVLSSTHTASSLTAKTTTRSTDLEVCSTKVLVENLKQTDQLQDLRINGRVAINLILLKQDINPLTLELNPSKQGCLLEFFTGDFKFYCLLLGKKAYLIDFSFKFNEIKFCTVLMNW